MRALPFAVVCAFLAPVVLLFVLRAAGITALDIPGVLSFDGGASPRFAINLVGPFAAAVLVAAAISLVASRRPR